MPKVIIDNKKNIVFALFALITLIAAFRHELWFDEAQAWCIVRDNSFTDIIRQLRYEGHPALWYIILLPFARMGASCEVIPLISWAFSTAAMWCIVFRSPFGDLMKTAVLLSGGSLFYNSVISRPYSVIQLLLCIIAMAYPERKKHPVLFGILIALLANTHVIMCGISAFFGIRMITELLKDIGSNSVKQNIYAFIGIFTVGCGGIAVILPLIGSVGLNNMVSKPSEFTADSFGNMLFILSDTMKYAVFSAFDVPLKHFAASVLSVFILIFLILFRYDRKCLAGELTFIFSYAVIDGLIWRNNTNRACIFIFVPVIFYWISLNEEGRVFVHKRDGIKSGIALMALKADENGKKCCGVLLTVLLFCTAPAAAYTLAADITGDFSPARKAAEYIKKNIPTDAVLVNESDFPPQLAAYLPGYRFYSISEGGFFSYSTHVSGDRNEVKEPPEFEKAYEIITSGVENYIFLADGYIPFDVNYRYIGIYRYHRRKYQ